ncbi:MAG: hypothetical protein KME14_00860 [Tildeniella torsiva UHER 1998/13D]|jgi:hypothetical protein|nr:hypothetical protein [Tildeniella torsiva UHER 1998/13D]
MTEKSKIIKGFGEYIMSPSGSFLIVPVALSFIALIIPEIDAITAKVLFGFSVGLISVSLPLQFQAYDWYKKTLDCYKESNELHRESNKFMIEVLKRYRDSKKNQSKIFLRIVDKYHDEFIETLETLAEGYVKIGKGHLYTGNLVLSGSDSIKLARKKVLAVETGQDPKKWREDEKFKSYTSANIEVARRENVIFERIWVIKRDTEKQYHQLWNEHQLGNIDIFYVFEDIIDDDYLKYIDFVIIDDEIVYAANVSSNNRGRKLYNGGSISQRLSEIEKHQRHYETLKRYGQEYKGY